MCTRHCSSVLPQTGQPRCVFYISSRSSPKGNESHWLAAVAFPFLVSRPCLLPDKCFSLPPKQIICTCFLIWLLASGGNQTKANDWPHCHFQILCKGFQCPRESKAENGSGLLKLVGVFGFSIYQGAWL